MFQVIRAMLTAIVEYRCLNCRWLLVGKIEE